MLTCAFSKTIKKIFIKSLRIFYLYNHSLKVIKWKFKSEFLNRFSKIIKKKIQIPFLQVHLILLHCHFLHHYQNHIAQELILFFLDLFANSKLYPTFLYSRLYLWQMTRVLKRNFFIEFIHLSRSSRLMHFICLNLGFRYVHA